MTVLHKLPLPKDLDDLFNCVTNSYQESDLLRAIQICEQYERLWGEFEARGLTGYPLTPPSQ